MIQSVPGLVIAIEGVADLVQGSANAQANVRETTETVTETTAKGITIEHPVNVRRGVAKGKGKEREKERGTTVTYGHLVPWTTDMLAIRDTKSAAVATIEKRNVKGIDLMVGCAVEVVILTWNVKCGRGTIANPVV
jgi:hypothetical protein